MSSLSNIKLYPPHYYAPDDTNIQNAKNDTLIIRIFYASLPFIALHRPFGQAITLTMDSIRTASTFSRLIDHKNSKELIKTAIAVAALAGTIFMHPLGLCISSLRDLGCDVTAIIVLLQAGHSQETFLALLSMAQHLLYLGMMISGTIEVIAISLLLNMAMEIARSRKEFQKGNFIEASSHLLMSVVRFSQAVPVIEKTAFKYDNKEKEWAKAMADTVTKVRNWTALLFFRSSCLFITPLWKLTNNWIETISLYRADRSLFKCHAISTTVSTIALLPLSLGGLIVGQALHFSGFLLSTVPYIHLQSHAPSQESPKQFSLFQLNCCLTSGGFSRLFGGVARSNTERAQKIAEMILEKNPDLVCLQEVSSLEDALTIYNKLSPEFAEFYFNIGSTPFILQNNSGLFVASKTAVFRPEFHSFSDISNVESMVNKGYFLFSTQVGNFIATHLSPSSDDAHPTTSEIDTRDQEQRKILLSIEQRSTENNQPSFIVGDFNINWDSSEYKESVLMKRCTDQYNEDRQTAPDRDATCETDFLISHNWRHDKNAKPQHLIIDYFLSFFHSNPPTIDTSKIETFDIDNPRHAISDHAGLLTRVQTACCGDIPHVQQQK